MKKLIAIVAIALVVIGTGTVTWFLQDKKPENQIREAKRMENVNKIEESKKTDETLTYDEIDEMEEVDKYIEKILKEESFKKLVKEERIKFMENELIKLATEGTEKIRKPLIKKQSISVDTEHNPSNTLISFEYACGVLGGTMIPDEMELTYKINNEMGSNNSRYAERGVYYDTLNSPNAPSYYFIAMGKQNTGGYLIKIEKVEIDENENVKVNVSEIYPGPGTTVTMAFTYPVCCLELSKKPKSIEIKNTQGEVFNYINF